jgi:2-oxoglutarate ferredoxin oxidoreductase subunit delta
MKYWRKPLDHEKYTTPKGEIHIIADRCKGCGFCIEFCPNDVLEESEEFNIKGYHPPKPEYPDKCIYCRLCELICPDFAIYVTEYIENGKKIKNKKKTTESSSEKDAMEVVEHA